MVAQWNEIDSTTQDALINWYNLRREDIRAKDRTKLAQLYFDGDFSFWACPHCGTYIYVGEPKNWNDFQGISQSEYIGELCADCGDLYLRLKRYTD